MATTILDLLGTSSTPTVSGTLGQYVTGPPSPSMPYPCGEGVYLLQDSTPTYRWIEDRRYCPPVPSPTTYTAV